MKVIIDYDKKIVSDINGIYECGGYHESLGFCETIDSYNNWRNGIRISEQYEDLIHRTYLKVFRGEKE